MPEQRSLRAALWPLIRKLRPDRPLPVIGRTLQPRWHRGELILPINIRKFSFWPVEIFFLLQARKQQLKRSLFSVIATVVIWLQTPQRTCEIDGPLCLTTFGRKLTGDAECNGVRDRYRPFLSLALLSKHNAQV